jgi:hypothetical protein
MDAAVVPTVAMAVIEELAASEHRLRVRVIALEDELQSAYSTLRDQARVVERHRRLCRTDSQLQSDVERIYRELATVRASLAATQEECDSLRSELRTLTLIHEKAAA